MSSTETATETPKTQTQSSGFVAPGDTLTVGPFAPSPTKNTLGKFTLPNTGDGVSISLALLNSPPGFCGGTLCKGKVVEVSPFGDYNDPLNPPSLRIRFDKSVVTNGTNGTFYKQTAPNGPITQIPECAPRPGWTNKQKYRSAILKALGLGPQSGYASPSPCIDLKWLAPDGDLIVDGARAVGRPEDRVQIVVGRGPGTEHAEVVEDGVCLALGFLGRGELAQCVVGLDQLRAARARRRSARRGRVPRRGSTPTRARPPRSGRARRARHPGCVPARLAPRAPRREPSASSASANAPRASPARSRHSAVRVSTSSTSPADSISAKMVPSLGQLGEGFVEPPAKRRDAPEVHRRESRAAAVVHGAPDSGRVAEALLRPRRCGPGRRTPRRCSSCRSRRRPRYR